MDRQIRKGKKEVMNKTEGFNLHKIISEKSILVAGDVMLDVYCNGNISRISPEAPVPVFKKSGERSVPGGAANVAVNLKAAGQKVSLLAVFGNDENGSLLRKKLEKMGIDCSLSVTDTRITTTKTRFLADNNQQILRLDMEDDTDVPRSASDLLLESLDKRIREFDLIVVSDYRKGLLSRYFLQNLIHKAEERKIPAVIDVKDPDISKYVGAYLLKPNLAELRALTGMAAGTEEEIREASESLRKQCSCEYVLTTCGARGMLLVGEGSSYRLEASGREVFDVTGAGDTAIAYLAACLSNGVCIEHAVEIANAAAGLQVTKAGASVVTLDELDAPLRGYSPPPVVSKLLSYGETDRIRSENNGKKIVFTNGCFDILHIGHIRYLEQASKLGDVLVIGVNSDASVQRLKGEGRPVNPQEERAELLASLTFVDYVIIFSEDTPYELIRQIRPEVLVKGSDYRPEEVIGADLVEGYGGRLELLPFVEGKSTTHLIERVKRSFRQEEKTV